MQAEGKIDDLNRVFMHVMNQAAIEVFTQSPLQSEERVSSAQLLGALLEQRRRRRELLGKA
eukprot:9082106-Pyramimonas_sp.AAC.1